MAAERAVQIDVIGGAVDGDLVVPDEAAGIVLFAHGSGSGRHSQRNRMVAASLGQRRFATLLMDLLTAEEEAVDARTRHLRFDVGLLADRLTTAAEWVANDSQVNQLPMGYFGASTGAAAALVAAASRPYVGAVVSRGGRPDLAGDHLPDVQAPTLLIVGGGDDVVLGLNKEAAAMMKAERRLEIVPGATHLFAEQGALEEVARLAGGWFETYLGSAVQNGRGATDDAASATRAPE